MAKRIGVGYKGTNALKLSSSMQEIVPSPPANWTIKYNFYRFSFMNNQDCTVIVNGQETIFLPAGRGFEVSEIDAPITSFVIVEAGVNYYFISGY